MELDVKQINNLLTGIVLACELKADKPEIRNFLTVKSFKLDSDGNHHVWDNKIKSADIGDNALFIVHCYSVPAEYIDLDYDIHNGDLIDDVIIDNIIGWDKLYEVLSKYIDDVSILVPQWNCDNPME